jgi:Arc/MetJ-type ribon-helix-helix transcriptional regulator
MRMSLVAVTLQGMAQITVRVPDPTVEAIDALVRSGRFSDRSEAVREALAELILADAYARAYGAQPETDEELAGAEAELRDAILEEPW